MKRTFMLLTQTGNPAGAFNIPEFYAADRYDIPTPEQEIDPEYWKGLLESHAHALARAFQKRRDDKDPSTGSQNVDE